MKKRISKNQALILTAIAAIILLAASVLTFAQTGIGKKYGSRDPRTCADRTLPKNGAISAEKAKEYVICETEHAPLDLYLAEDVTVQVGAARRYNAGEDFNFPNIDVKSPVYAIRGSLKKYNCSIIYQDRSNLGKNCNIYNEPNAKGACYKDTFGDWHCGMTDATTGNYIAENVPPPGSVKPTDAPKNKNTTQNNKNGTTGGNNQKEDKNVEKPTADGYPVPDFSELSDYYELVKYSYDYPNSPYLMLTVKLKKNISPANINFSVHFLDEDGAEVGYTGGQPFSEGGRAGDVIHTKVGAPTEADMRKVKTIVFRR